MPDSREPRIEQGAQESMSKPTALIGITGAALDSLCEKIAKLEKEIEELAVKLGIERTHSAHLENQVEGLRAALRNVLTEAVILSENYLEVFNNQPDTVTIQGWDKARWRRALAAKKQAEAALATQLPTEKG